jgi:hypothetical protein
MMKKTLFVTLMASLMVLFSGCGSNDFDGDGNTTTSIKLTVVTPAGGTYAITTADHDYSVVLKVTDDDEPLSGKVVKIATTSFVGSFSAAQATTDEEGKATFTYHSPGSVDTGSTFTVTYALEDDANVSATITFNIGSGGTTPDSNNAKYKIEYTLPDALRVNSTDNMEVKIVSISDDQVIDDGYVQEVTLTSTLTNILTFAEGANTTTYTALGKNTNITIQSKTLSGIATLQIRAVIQDGSSEIVLTKTLSVTVLAGPVTSMSIPYVDSGP